MEGRVYQINISAGGVPKRPVERAVLGPLGLAGDEHNDRANHGGPERAVCLFSLEVIRVLAAEGHAVAPGVLGENLTLVGLEWSRLRPGDRLRVGPALIEVTRFTTPCINIKPAFKDGRFDRVLEQYHPGQSRVYARVIEGGQLATGDPVTVMRPAPTAADPGPRA
ncbi:MAG: MOSC domain-containing protein [Chloroflexi bacterium]|nr:MOSC domain-containing protein [Chloroflexota bacterium]